MDPAPLAIYVHWPFCKAKCPYCDFNVHLNNREEDSTWIEAYLKALDFYARDMPPRRVEAVFFGGGTPSLMPPALVAALLERLGRHFALSPALEVTLEANPTSSEIDRFRDFKAAGVTRLSVGVQSLIPEDLVFLGRRHSAEEGLRAIDMAQTLFERSSFDLIYARPGQSLSAWEAELERAIGLAAGHLSLYELTIEERTAFYKRHRSGEFSLPDEDMAVDFYDFTFRRMAEAGLPAYEISNYGAAGQACRYNVMTWEYCDYIGIGPGAHGRITRAAGAMGRGGGAGDAGGRKYASFENRVPAHWLRALEETGSGAESFEALDADDIFEERLIAGLRMTGGMDVPEDFETRINRPMLEHFIREGWLDFTKTPGTSGTSGTSETSATSGLSEVSGNPGTSGSAQGRLRLKFEGLLRYDSITRALLSGRSGGGARAGSGADSGAAAGDRRQKRSA